MYTNFCIINTARELPNNVRVRASTIPKRFKRDDDGRKVKNKKIYFFVIPMVLFMCVCVCNNKTLQDFSDERTSKVIFKR